MEKKKKNKLEFDELNENVRCIDCNRPLKMNVTDRKENPKRCFVCGQLSKGKKTRQKGRKTIDLYDVQAKARRAYKWQNRDLK